MAFIRVTRDGDQGHAAINTRHIVAVYSEAEKTIIRTVEAEGRYVVTESCREILERIEFASISMSRHF